MVYMTIDRYITGAKKFYDEVLNRDITAKDVRRGLTGLVAGAVALTAVAGTDVREARADSDALADYLLGKALGRATKNVVDEAMGKNDQQQTTQQSEPRIIAQEFYDRDNSDELVKGRILSN